VLPCAVEIGLFLVVGMGGPDMSMAMPPSCILVESSRASASSWLVSGSVRQSLRSIRCAFPSVVALRWIVALDAVCLGIDGFDCVAAMDFDPDRPPRMARRRARSLHDGGLQFFFFLVFTSSPRPWLVMRRQRATGSRRKRRWCGLVWRQARHGGVRLRE